MNFTSPGFYVFLAIAVLVVQLKSSNEFKKNFLLGASYYFYMCWDWRFALLLFSLTLLNFVVGAKIHSSKAHKKQWLILSLLGSLSVLGVFKYLGFFVDSLSTMVEGMGLQSHLPVLEILLPVGISFYTFQALSYTIDIYRGDLKPTSSPRDFFLFVSFFPQLVAGPIVRARDFLPQLENSPQASEKDRQFAMFLIVRGLIKKVILADVLALHIVDPAFSASSSYSSTFLLVAIVAYSFQVFLDFSAYTDIARGAAMMIGYRLPENFDQPYLAHSISNFWQRWHISMSSFFRDYVFFGLGGSKRGNVYVNVVVTFIVIGMWHGAGWTFILYGLLHGLIVALERYGRQFGLFLRPTSGAYLAVSVIRTFTIVVTLRVLFRSEDIGSAAAFVSDILSGGWVSVNEFSFVSLLALTASMASHYVTKRQMDRIFSGFLEVPAIFKSSGVFALICMLVVFGGGSAPFIYFQF